MADKAMSAEQLALDIRTDEQRDLDERLALFRDHMARDWRNPKRYIHVNFEWNEEGKRQVIKRRLRATPVGGDLRGWVAGWHNATRCGRCGEVMDSLSDEWSHGHNGSFCGCPRDRERYGVSAFQYLDKWEDTLRALCDREDRSAFPDCKRCGHPWRLHGYHDTLPPGIDGRPGGGGHCLVYCGCRCYLPSAMAVTPWGTCPGCWGAPHKGECR